MKVLSLHQPWATLIALGVKRIETRSWPAPKGLTGQRIAIHAAQRYPADGPYPSPGHWETDAKCGAPELVEYGADETRRHSLPLGAIVATAVLAGCPPICSSNPEHLIPDAALIDPGPEFGLRWTEPDRSNLTGRGWIIHGCEDQRPFGDFTPGRWAWMLAEVKPVDPPVPFKGGQGLTKEWTP